ncbi:collagen binding domain-containing protein, partial [Leuconostoc falkenbergense]|uniref:collagen binding domain-containing protein n=1 Tax=Leuconostoc falkenbergense TaxID=2766470 RepID=UPI003BAE3EC6
MQRFFSRQMPIVMLTILFLQFLSSFASVYAVTTTNTSTITEITQKGSKVDLSISMAGIDDEKTKDTLVIGNTQLIDLPDDGKITDENGNTTIASYEKASSNTLKITRLTDKVTTGHLILSVKQSGTEIFKLNDGEDKSIALVLDDKSSSTSSQSSISSQSGSGSVKAAAESSSSATKSAITKSSESQSEDTEGVDISQYLPQKYNDSFINSAELKFTDKDGKDVLPQQVKSDTNINLKYIWSIPNDLNNEYQVKPGDYFTFQLPAGIQYKPGQSALVGGFGDYKIEADGKVTITFNDSVKDNDTISGSFNYSSFIDSQTTTGEKTIVIPTKDGPIPHKIVVNPIGGNGIAKSGFATGANSANNNPNGITWDVTINTNGQQLNNATVSDPMPTDATGNVPTTFKTAVVTPLTVDLSGKVTGEGTPLIAGTDYTVDGNGKITFIGAYANTYSAFKIRYTSDIDTSKLPDDGGKLSFTNKATLNNNGSDYPAQATVNTSFGQLLNKKFDGQDSSGSQLYNWHIDYNYGEKKLAAGTKLVDTLSSGQRFNDVPKLVDESGKTLDPSSYNVSYNSDKSEMTITFPDGLDKGVKVSYQSKVLKPIDSNDKVSNTATSNGKSTSSNDNVITQQGLIKTLGAVDYNVKTAIWNFDINKARQDMSNWSMTDPVPDGLTVDYKSLVLIDKDTKTTLTEGTDYTITKDKNGFRIDFINSLKSSAKDWYTLSYKTSFDTNQLKGGKWTNTADATWKDKDGKSHTNSSRADFVPKTDFQKDGSKSGSYNAVNKHITWTVVGNYNQRTLKSASIVDQIQDGEGQAYVDNSAKLYEATINTNGSYKLGSEVANADIKFDSDNNTLTAKLPDNSTSAYVLVFDTTLDGKIINQTSGYTNNAKYTNSNNSSDLAATVSVPYSGKLAIKEGSQDSTNSSYAKYDIWVNKSQSTLKNVVVDDAPSENQIIDESSIVINSTKVDKSGNFTEDTSAPLLLNKDYRVDLTTDSKTGTQKLKISFLNQISTAYVINYRSLINSSKTNDVLHNSVIITGDNEQTYSEKTTTDTNVVNNGGSATGKNTNLVINKTDGDTKKALPGASFELYSDVNGRRGQLLRSGKTDSDGQLSWNNLKSGKYILVETAAPDGYDIDSSYGSGKEISLSYASANNDNNVILNVANGQKTGSVVLTKTDSDTGKVLAGATFSLYKADGSEVAKDLKTDDKGQINQDNLKPGDYYFVETAAPAGYNFDKDKKYNVTVLFQDKANAGKVATVSATNAQKTGSVLLTKTDSDTGKVLAGATFSLYKADGS